LLKQDRDVTRKLSRRLRKVTKGLGGVRELDVLTLLIQELAEDGRYAPAAVRQLAAAVATQRAGARERLSAKLPIAKLQRLSRMLERVAERLESGDTESLQR